MLNFRLSFIMSLFCLSAVTHAQFSHQFTNTAHIDTDGYGYGVTLGPYGTVFIANGNGGMFA